MDLYDTLLHYGEWLDSQGLIVPDDTGDDDRSHDDLARDFVRDWESHPDRDRLAGR